MSFGKLQSPKSSAQYIHNLIMQGHESVLEHANWTFLLTGVSRAFTHQLVRHRPGFAFSQLSQQYHNETNAQFVEPECIRHIPKARKLWKDSVKQALNSYKQLLALIESRKSSSTTGVAQKELTRLVRSAARSVLPNATETKIVVSANARALRHFLSVRGGIVGDEEMRKVSAALLAALRKEAPSLFGDFTVQRLADGSPCVTRRQSNL
jgi:thymidylate synthase (FAD)